jgi:hypothetical protein
MRTGRGTNSSRPVVATVMVVSTWLAVAPPLAAQEPRTLARTLPGQQRGTPEPDGLTVPELERYFDSYEIFEAQRALQLDDQQFLVVGQRLQQMQRVRRRHQNQRRMLLGELREAVASGLVDRDEAAVTERLARLNELGVTQAQELRRAHQALDAILTVRQRVQFRLFQERFERRRLELLAAARRGRSGGW